MESASSSASISSNGAMVELAAFIDGALGSFLAVSFLAFFSCFSGFSFFAFFERERFEPLWFLGCESLASTCGTNDCSSSNFSLAFAMSPLRSSMVSIRG